MINAIIVDDEPLAHEVIAHHLQALRDVNIIFQCHSAAEALSWLANNSADLLFLDINMPQLNGIDMLKVLAKRPQVVIISAYQEYALQGFELDVTDYLLKPVSEQRLSQALDKVRQRNLTINPVNHKSTVEQHILLKVDREQRKFKLADISLLEAYGNYVKLWQGNHMTLVSSSLKQLAEKLPNDQFVKVHKSFIVNSDEVTAFSKDALELVGGRNIKIGNAFKEGIEQIKSKLVALTHKHNAYALPKTTNQIHKDQIQDRKIALSLPLQCILLHQIHLTLCIVVTNQKFSSDCETCSPLLD